MTRDVYLDYIESNKGYYIHLDVIRFLSSSDISSMSEYGYEIPEEGETETEYYSMSYDELNIEENELFGYSLEDIGYCEVDSNLETLNFYLYV